MIDDRQTVYDTHPENWDRLARAGYENLAEMAKHFYICADMDRALGYQNAVSRWNTGNGYPARASEDRAKEWLDARKPKPEPQKVVPQEGCILMVACSAAVAEKAKRVLAVLGCEVTEI